MKRPDDRATVVCHCTWSAEGTRAEAIARLRVHRKQRHRGEQGRIIVVYIGPDRLPAA